MDSVSENNAHVGEKPSEVGHVVDIEHVLAGGWLEARSDARPVSFAGERLSDVFVECITMFLRPFYLCPTSVQ